MYQHIEHPKTNIQHLLVGHHQMYPKNLKQKKSSSIERTSSKKETEQKRKSPEPPKLPSRVEALYDCDGDEDDELTFVTGEIIQVTGQEDDDWWIGNIESQPHRHGCFPVIFVRSLDGAG